MASSAQIVVSFLELSHGVVRVGDHRGQSGVPVLGHGEGEDLRVEPPAYMRIYKDIGKV